MIRASHQQSRDQSIELTSLTMTIRYKFWVDGVFMERRIIPIFWHIEMIPAFTGSNIKV